MIEIIDPGLLAALQGTPYRGTRNIGMPLSGPADPISMAIANKLVSNPSDAPTIEFSILGGMIKAHSNCMIGLVGPIQSVTINDILVDHFISITVQKNDIVSITASNKGAHIYLAVNGGFRANRLWHGNSTFLPAHIGGYHGRPLQSGDMIEHDNAPMGELRTQPARYRLSYGTQHVMRICMDDDASSAQLTQNIWKIGHQGNRIGYELLNSDANMTTINFDGKSRAVFPGTIQCPPSGNPFLLGVDAQTTGGYPIIGHVIRADRHSIGQIKNGDTLRFIKNKPHEARRVYLKKLEMWQEYIPDLRLD